MPRNPLEIKQTLRSMPPRKPTSVARSEVDIQLDAAGKQADTRQQATEAVFLHFFTNVHLLATAMNTLGPADFSPLKNRILGFATMTPGITVGELARAFRVSNQNLNQPMRRLIDEGHLIVKIGDEDRRQKRLFASVKGRRLFGRVLRDQQARLQRAFNAAGPEATKGFLEVHRHLVDASDREWVARAIGSENSDE